MTLRIILERMLEIPLVYRLHARMVDQAKESAIRAIRPDYTGLRVLDIGCGPGNNTELFSGSSYTGIDVNPRYIAKASAAYPRARFLVGDATRIELPGPFDVVLMNSFLHHLDDKGVGEVLSAAARVLGPEGLAIVQEPLIPERTQHYHRLLMRLDRGNYFRSVSGWEELAGGAGLEVGRREFYSLRVFGLKGYRMLSLALARPSRG